MTTKEKAKLVKQAGKLYTLGLTVEKRRDKLRRLVEKKVPYDSPQMKEALSEFQAADEEWKRLERAHLEYRNQLGIENKNF
ncbi:hypothetical protein [Hydrogenoanaerobacterium sp.]|uniref:hypothetical protein n=1 Tax=Hydrogenoanaerobacterium sp. TaxID=2953763 RepID=UPI00289C521D|nr:hypothetical protein [Hydrogenoanaerobacterium sp.]